MRVLAFYVCLFLFLFCGNTSLHAQTYDIHKASNPPHAPVKTRHHKLTNTERGNPVIDDAEIDLDEEYLSEHDLDERTVNNFLTEKYSLADRWYFTFTDLCLSNHYYKRVVTYPSFCDLSSPLYITQRVLRI